MDTDNKPGWSSLTVVNSPVERPAPAFGIRRTGSNLENDDMAAAREFGLKRREPVSGAHGANPKAAGGAPGWLAGDPFRWGGGRSRQRRSRTVFTVRQVFHSGRVELKKTFMLYLTTVNAIRAEYDPAT